jgi:Family of unknown function (DUF6491)
MTRFLRSFLFLILAATQAAAQNDPPLTGTPCLLTANVVDSHPLPGRRSLVVIDRDHKQYRLNFTAACESLQVKTNLGFQTFNPSRYACLSRGDSVFSSNDVGANRLCRIQAIEFYNAESPAPTPDPATGRRARG